LNNDGYPDIAVANFGNESISVFLGSSTGQLQTPNTTEMTGTAPTSIGIGDMNEDGNLDIVIGCFATNDLYIWLGDGTGQFTVSSGSPFAGFVGAENLVLGDVNGDTRLDVVMAQDPQSAFSYNFTVALGDGAAGFLSIREYSTSFSTGFSARLGDLNGDSKPDIVIAISGDPNYSVEYHFQNGNGTFTGFNPQASFSTSEDCTDAEIADLNRDGINDLIIPTSANHVIFLFGNGDGTFSQNIPAPKTITPSTSTTPTLAPVGSRVISPSSVPSQPAASGAVTSSSANKGGSVIYFLILLVLTPSWL